MRLSSIGDVVRVLPALQALREALPEAQIDWIIDSAISDIVANHPDIDTILMASAREISLASICQLAGACRQVRNRQYDIVLDFHACWRSALITWSSMAPERWGFPRWRCTEGSHLATNHKASLPRKNMNWVEEFMALCQPLTGRAKPGKPKIRIPSSCQQLVDRWTSESIPARTEFVLMHPPATSVHKRWPPEFYGELADQLARETRYSVVFSHGPGQFDSVRCAQISMKAEALIAPVFPTLTHYAHLAQKARLFIGGDTGPMHIASAMGTPVVAIFGGSNPLSHRPYFGPNRVLCDFGITGGSKRLSGAQRMSRVSPSQVYAACVELLSETEKR